MKQHLLDFLFNRKPNFSSKHTIDLESDFWLVDIKKIQTPIKRLQILKDYIYLLEDDESFRFEVLKNSEMVKNSIEYLKENFKKEFDTQLKESKKLKEIDYKEYAKFRYRLMLLISLYDFFVGFEDEKEKYIYVTSLLSYGYNVKSFSLAESVSNELSENDKLVSSSLSKKEFFYFKYVMFRYFTMVGANTQNSQKHKRDYLNSAKEYFEVIKSDDKKVVAGFKLYKISGIGDEKNIQFFKDRVLETIKEDINLNISTDLEKSKKFVKNYLFYQFHNDIKKFIDELSEVFDSILRCREDIENCIENRKLYSAKRVCLELDKLYEKCPQYLENSLKSRVENGIEIYENRISNSVTYKEFQKAKELCVDDEDIKAKEDKFFDRVLKEINRLSDLNDRYEALKQYPRFNSYAKELLEKEGLKNIDKFYINGIEALKKSSISLMRINGDMNINFSGLSSQNRFIFEIYNGELLMEFERNGKEQHHFIKEYIPDSKKFEIFDNFYKIENGRKYRFSGKITLMIGFALMADVEIKSYKLYFRFYKNSNEKIRKFVMDKMKLDFWKGWELEKKEFIFFKDDEALKEFNVFKENGVYFQNGRPIFENKLSIF